MTPFPGWLTSEQAAERIGISPKNMINFLGWEKVKRKKVGLRYLYNEADVAAVIEWRNSPDAAGVRSQGKANGGKATAKKPKRATKRPLPDGKQMTTSNDEKYTYIPAPFEVPERWEWSA